MSFPVAHFSAFLLVAALAYGTASAPPQVPDAPEAYKALTGDDFPIGDPPPAAAGAWAGGEPGAFIVATLDGDDGASDLGNLRVGLLVRRGAAWKLAASDVTPVSHPAVTRVRW